MPTVRVATWRSATSCGQTIWVTHEQTSNAGSIGKQSSLFLVAATSGLVLVIEILAGRLMAPYVGVSIDTFTGIIGTILGGIALGAAGGGILADRYDPVRLIAQALILGGALTWVSVPIVSAIGPAVGSGPIAIVTLAATSFVLPTAVLSGIGPMVAKLELEDLEESGAVVGRLSAASTFGALLGTFGTGFILIALLPVRTIMFVIGAVLVVAGIAFFAKAKSRPTGSSVVLVIMAGLLSFAINTPCDETTAYYCIRVVADDPELRPGGRSLVLDQLRHAHVDLDDPTFLDIRYMRLFANAEASLAEGPINVLHIGGGGFTLPRYIDAVRPGSSHTVLELDEDLVPIIQRDFGLPQDHGYDIRFGDARIQLAELEADSYDLIVGDAYSGVAVPWHLATVEVVEEIDRLLDDDGIYIANIIDGNQNRFIRSQLATLGEVFGELVRVEPDGGTTQRAQNQLVVAAHQPIGDLAIAPEDGRQLDASELATFVGDDALILRDNFAPADQLLP